MHVLKRLTGKACTCLCSYQLRLPASGGKWLALHAGASTDLLSDDTLFSKLSFESGFSVETWKDGIGDETGVLLGAMLISHVSE